MGLFLLKDFVNRLREKRRLPAALSNEYKTQITKNKLNSITVSVGNVLVGQGLKYTIN